MNDVCVCVCVYCINFVNDDVFVIVNPIGGTASYLLGMSTRVAALADSGNTPANVKQLSLGWMFGFLFAVSFVGLFSIVPLRKVIANLNLSSCL